MRLKKLLSRLKKKNLTIATAESCSAGYLSYLLTKTAGSSLVFKGGIVAYSLDIKHIFFGISSKTLISTQGVSRDVALCLAKKVRKLFFADIGLAIVGFAGPHATKKRRAGTVYLAIVTRKKSISKKIMVNGSRNTVRTQASMRILKLLDKEIVRGLF